MKSKLMTGVVFLLFLLCSTTSYALMVSDSPIHDSADHDTAEWQRLGLSNLVDDAVWWSINGGTYGRDNISAGDTIQFKFTMWRAGYGRHDYDQIKSWVDWDQNGVFDNSAEVIHATQWFKGDTKVPDNEWDPVNNPAHTYGGYMDFFSDTHTIANHFTGDLWLRARVHCNHTTFDTITPYGNLWQGEVEDWKVAPVPEPATMVLLGFGLIGLAGLGRKKLLKK